MGFFAIALFTGIALQIPTPLEVLLMIMGVDIGLGILYAIKKHDLSSKIMQGGLLRKAAVILIIFALYAFDKEYSKIIRFEIANAAVFAFTIRELLSIIENAAKLGAPIPEWLRQRLRGFEVQQERDHEEN